MKHLILLAALISTSALAGEKVVATLTIGTGAATSSAALTTGTADWSKGGIVLLQCDQDVYISWDTVVCTTTVTVATSAMQRINFSSNNDPYIIYLGVNDKDVSVLAVSSAGTCKFIKTPFRRKPN